MYLQGSFRDSREYDKMPQDWKDRAKHDESCSIRFNGERLCQCKDPLIAKTLVKKLNKADKSTPENISGVVIEWMQQCGYDYDSSDIESLENMIEKKLKTDA